MQDNGRLRLKPTPGHKGAPELQRKLVLETTRPNCIARVQILDKPTLLAVYIHVATRATS